jgi:hypothetical protein
VSCSTRARLASTRRPETAATNHDPSDLDSTHSGMGYPPRGGTSWRRGPLPSGVAMLPNPPALQFRNRVTATPRTKASRCRSRRIVGNGSQSRTQSTVQRSSATERRWQATRQLPRRAPTAPPGTSRQDHTKPPHDIATHSPCITNLSLRLGRGSRALRPNPPGCLPLKRSVCACSCRRSQANPSHLAP